MNKEFRIRTSTENYGMRELFFLRVTYNMWVLFNFFFTLARNASIERLLISVDEMKFYYDWMFFRLEDFASKESLRGLPLQ